jgi:tRNA threonylcarbamoyladenosine biosynthesis protein TsaB
MATAKGYAAALGVDLLGVSTLDVLAAAWQGKGPICSVIDARKKELYWASYFPDEQGVPRRLGEPRALAPEQLAAELSGPKTLVGDGGVVYREVLLAANPKLEFSPVSHNQPSAAILGLLCGEQLAAGSSLDLNTSEPLYVRGSDAELNLAQKKQAEARKKAAALQP